jgi:hypothetical protein
MIYGVGRRGHDRGIQEAMNETTHPKPGAKIMTTLAQTTQIGSRKARRVTIGSVLKIAAAVAVVGTISVFSIAQLSRAQPAPTVAADLANQTELRNDLCQIYRGCTHQTELRDLLCRIDHRCPSAGEASRMAAEITAR